MAKNSCGEPEFNLDGVNCDFYTDINNDGHIISGGLFMDILSYNVYIKLMIRSTN